jgi:predicted pyridoxine 5'-phosphate oxidase superfamily flavin-nucleotide-binding protein
MPPLSPDQIAFLEGPNTLAIATQDGNLVPEVTRALTLRCRENDRVVVWVAAHTAGRAVANLKREPRIALGVSRPSTHQTFQLKGRAVAVTEAGPEAQATIEQAFENFLQEAGAVGLPARLLQPVVRWPALEIVVEVNEIYDQTPGPGAGEKCPQ